MAVRSTALLAFCLLGCLALGEANKSWKPKPTPAPVPSPYTPQCKTAYQVISEDSRLTGLKRAIDSTGLSGLLNKPDFVGTIFAPTSDAILVCFKIGCLDRPTTLFHVLSGLSYRALDLIATGNPSSYLMANLGTTTVRFINIQNKFTISGPSNTANIIQANIPFCKGYVHVIDTVLNPSPAPVPVPVPTPVPSPGPTPGCRTAFDVIQSLPQFAGFTQLLLRTGRSAVLSDPDFQGTIFASLITNVAPPGASEVDAIDTFIIPNVVSAFPTPLAGATYQSRQGRFVTILFDNNPPGPQNLRMSIDNGRLTAFLNPGTVNLGGCGGNYVIHAVGQIFYPSTTQPLIGK